jgi:hypothetical protein
MTPATTTNAQKVTLRAPISRVWFMLSRADSATGLVDVELLQECLSVENV